MERVMHMKKVLIVILALILLLGGLFFWKGGHHAIALSEWWRNGWMKIPRTRA